MLFHIKEELRKSTFSATHRTKEEIMKPFENEDSPVTQSGLVLLSVDKVILESPSYDHFRSSYTQNGQFLSLLSNLQSNMQFL